MKNPHFHLLPALCFLLVFVSCDVDTDPKLLPAVSTFEVTEITQYSAQSGGLVLRDGGSDVTARGVCWSTSPNPTISDTKTVNDAGTGAFTSTLGNLIPATTYFLRAYATNKRGTTYGLQVTFTTKSLSLSDLITTPVSAVTSHSAYSGGAITLDGGSAITARGVCWNVWPNPTISDSITVDGTGVGFFTSLLSGLKSGTLYYVRAYATNAQGTSYGNSVEFTTRTAVPELTTVPASSISTSSATSGGTVTHNGGNYVIARGVCWSTSRLPSVADAKTVNGNGSGPFTSLLTGLKSGTVYYLRAYATNESGTGYGDEITFTTIQGLPELTTEAVTSLTSTTAMSGGTIIHDGGASIVERGVCWSTSPAPTITNSRTRDGSGSSRFTSTITGLQPGTSYFLRTYATNSVGTAYGNEVSFYAPQTDDVYSAVTGKVWKDRNLGASRVATSVTDAEAYGDLYQWGRASDGHEKRTSSVTTTTSTGNTPGHGQFIGITTSPADWRSTRNDQLWQGVTGINNPCPEGYRIPTMAELTAERLSWTHNNSTGGFNSPLKLTLSGYRFSIFGAFNYVDKVGYYWSATVSGTTANLLVIEPLNAYVHSSPRSYGYSVRCVKD